jgi:hypothetical protein
MPTEPLPDRLMPLAASLGLVPLFGDIHNHCGISYGHGRLEDALARAALQLDFVSITGHAHWPDMPVDDPTVAHIVDFHVKGFARLRAGWMAHFAELAKAEASGLVVFPGYEIHSNAHGDYTILYRDPDPRPIVLEDTPATLRAALEAARPGAAFAFPHHIGYRLGARGIDWSAFDPALSPFVEMNSMHGCAEGSETERPYLHSMGPSDGEGTLLHGLALGHVFGVVGNTDHHSGFPGSYGHGRMAAYASGRDRDAIWQAMRDRRTNALTGDNIHLLASIGGATQGGIVRPGEALLEIEAVAGGFIDAIDVFRNGALAHRVTPELTPAPLSRETETLLHVEMGWGARGRTHRWDGELAIEGGSIEAVEPRFRGPEVVSPLEAERDTADIPVIERDRRGLRFAFTAGANPNNVTAATQGFMLRLRHGETASIRGRLCGQDIAIPLERLYRGAKSGNLGAIDSPAWRFHSLPRNAQWQWRGAIPLGELAAGETIHLRLRQNGGQIAWASPLFVRQRL